MQKRVKLIIYSRAITFILLCFSHVILETSFLNRNYIERKKKFQAHRYTILFAIKKRLLMY